MSELDRIVVPTCANRLDHIEKKGTQMCKLSRVYRPWIAGYSNEGFDRAQHLAYELNPPSPTGFGYSREAFAKAEKIVRAANCYADNFTGPVEYIK